MTIPEAIEARHSVREYLDKPIEEETANRLRAEIENCNRESGLHFQLITEDTATVKGVLSAVMRFKNASNYISMVGADTKENMEKIGYYGARLVLYAQTLGLNTCFILGTYRKNSCKAVINDGEEIIGVISVGYGKTQGKPHKSKELSALGKGESEWFGKGLTAAGFAPTGMNRQGFFLEQIGDKVKATPNTQNNMCLIDLGIVKYHFEIGADKSGDIWMKE
ncbi:MAG: nitroreductase family protein [Clostridia bacterium]|nr:nitroreductase family protein [Clostridia bacterium]